ncbi:MAG: CDP-diacylglycerol--glycerol-3-phosphate 3-phosphatidyltransferase [Gammaproteobacteria bacterium]|jgi:CDP-diacylglycerol--glycerol-3-phosphate 3-phosphatidyltransferase|nr:CDP-diacylglycerol--glycerol-3-phosphate 3-phosphatidyltransferase [Gammaproteobacteria bacterium]MBT4605525.1 CDP-diacylglycerol--glycerol-3-phosphate 3-phosphatidyltransferase [Thiotrichales bacterium]MBT4811399.1 CDP-diacylglycerol--glycerol-3-phosphate 3-phosphatidyltransferase [Thiotrichales bacterium]MBT5636101.1 CDP-diacylglycerol--glycerol-3-phosphate 3-phosphatidyltransferase [Gammaproteobacteria bacterium]MBT6078827.1 CDP-diacylglycerol--glycerol-3-phosphate 3-phosphatidyltransfera
MQFNIPTILTLLRIILIPFFVVAFYLPMEWGRSAAALIFVLAGVTDWLDGYLARKWDQTSPFGAFLDPVADKLMVAAALLLLVSDMPELTVVVPAIVIIGREIAISALREWMAEMGERAHVAVSMIGKIKTTAQMAAIFLLLYQQPIGPFPTQVVGMVLLYVAMVLTLWSMAIYLRAAWPILKGES